MQHGAQAARVLRRRRQQRSACSQQARSSPIGLAPLQLLLVDDHVLFRGGLVRLLAAQPDIKVIGEAGSVREAVARAERGDGVGRSPVIICNHHSHKSLD